MKSNDNIPADEALLAEALAAAHGLGFSEWSMFRDANGRFPAGLDDAVACSALGGLVLAGTARQSPMTPSDAILIRGRMWGRLRSISAEAIAAGNDCSCWLATDLDHGETMGHAFRLAKTEETEP